MRSHDRIRDLILIGLILIVPPPVGAERLPIRTYSTADGLAHEVVNKIVRDSHGFLWFATNDGLSRFDGYGFTNYSVEQGLPHRTVLDLVETKSGDFWVATLAGLVWFRPHGAPESHAVSINDPQTPTPMFAVVVPEDDDPRRRAFNVVVETADGVIWAGSKNGIFRLNRSDGRFRLVAVDVGIPAQSQEAGFVSDLLEDRTGSLWIGTRSGLYRRWPDGTTARYTGDEGLPDAFIHDLMLDHQHRIWIASRYGGFFRIESSAGHEPPVVRERYSSADGLSTTWVFRLLETSDGRFWAATNLGLAERMPAGATPRFRTYDRNSGLNHREISVLEEDAGGNLWLATGAVGAMRLARDGLVTYTEADGLYSAVDIFEDARGDFFVRADLALDPKSSLRWQALNKIRYTPAMVGRFTDGRFVLDVPDALWLGWAVEGTIVQTKNHEWWMGTGAGLARFAPAERWNAVRAIAPIRIYGTNDGLASPPMVFRLFADSRGDVWVSSIGGGWHGLSRWDRATDTLKNLVDQPGLPPVRTELARAFGEDRDGNVWIGFDAGAARYRDGRFVFFGAGRDLPPGIRVIHTDRRGQLWLGSQDGLLRVDHPSADRPAFIKYNAANGLSGNIVTTMTDGNDGCLYLDTGRGIDQLDPTTGRVRHFGVSDGLAPGIVKVAYRDRTGALWFGTLKGLSRLVPSPRRPASPPTVLVTDVAVAGTPLAVSAVGASNVVLPELRYASSQVDINFVGLGPDSGESLLYQYQLEGAPGGWGAPSPRRHVTYANLSPGRYRFLVRAVGADGLASAEPASVTFAVLPPFWRTWWFLTFAVGAVSFSGVVVHKHRVSRLLEVERMRTRIATDLHDDVGANLTRIAILSEVVQRSSLAEAGNDPKLATIGVIARESASVMNDIVWALNPERDTLAAMLHRMRHYAEEVFESCDVALTLDLAEPTDTPRLSLDLRRDIYLIFKEAVNNIARHSQCTRASVTFRVVDAILCLEVADNGRGFDVGAASEGTGLGSIRRRADRIGGTLEIISSAGSGSRISFSTRIEPAGAIL